MEKYKYICKFKNFEYIKDLIDKEAIFLNNPLNFNDPLDTYFAQFFDVNDKIKTMNIKEYLEIGKRLGIFCGTTENNIENVLLWSHYAENHKGVMIKYIIPEILEGKLEKVNYNEHSHEEFMKTIGYGNPFKCINETKEEKEAKILDSVFLKTNEWKYEEEIRYVKTNVSRDNPYEYEWKIDSIYLGAKYLKNSTEELKEIDCLVKMCMKKKIKVFTMSYEYCKIQKKMKLEYSKWVPEGERLEIENYSKILREIEGELLIRLENSIEGRLLEKYIGKISKRVFEEKQEEERTKTMIKLGIK